MLRIHHQVTTHSEPLSPILCPSKAKKVIPRLEYFTSLVHTWLDRGAPDHLRLRGICFREFEAVLRKFYSLGVEPRCDWDQESQTAVLRMPTRIHEEVGAFFACEVPDSVNKKLKRFSICGHSSVRPMASPDLPVGEKGSTVRPDQCLRLMQQDADGQLVYVQKAPRVILETSASESREHVMAKVMRCLYGMRGLHAAVVCDMKNIPPRTAHAAISSSKFAKPFIAEIAVWTRKTVGPLDPDPCYPREELGDHKLGDTVGLTGGLAPEQSHISSSSPVEGEGFDERAREYFRRDPRSPHQLQSIVRRSEDWITLYNAGIPTDPGEPEPELVLDLYDFIRPCSRFPHSYISDRKISIPLGILRRQLVLALENRQTPPRQSSALNTGLPTRGFHPSQGLHARQGRLSDTTAYANEMNLHRRLFTSATSPLLGTKPIRTWNIARSMGTRSWIPRPPISQGAPQTTSVPLLSGLFAQQRPIRAVPLFARLLAPGAAARMLACYTP